MHASLIYKTEGEPAIAAALGPLARPNHGARSLHDLPLKYILIYLFLVIQRGIRA